MRGLLVSLVALPGVLLLPSVAAAQGKSAEDVDPPASKRGSDLPFYRPPAAETRALAPPPPPLPPEPKLFSGLIDVHQFVAGSVVGTGTEARLRYGGTHNGVTLGMFNLGKAFVIGYDALRYAGVRLNPESAKLGMYVLLPNIDLRMMVGPDRLAAVAGTSLSGFRLATCNFEASVRVLTANAWFAGDFDKQSFQVSLGGSLSAGIIF
jgi:hypothetical protein